ncbi:hypothetical protein LXL04_035454 [Taraxacum kok-saghyz]
MDEVNINTTCTTVTADDSLSSASASVPWSPRQLVFRPYTPTSNTDAKSQNLRVHVKRPLVSRLTKDIVDTYRTCNPQFYYPEELLVPKRFLTSPSAGVLNDGYDNENSDLVLSVNFALVNPDTHRRYIVKEMLGQGTFGQVAKCWVAELERFVAVKIIKNQPAYYQQALVEVTLLTTLNKKFDPEDKHHIVRIYDYFVYQRHLCIGFELLDSNLYEIIKLNHFRGLSLSIVQLFSKQILCGLSLMKDAAIIHCDLKPENILLCTSVKPAAVKIIDFGSACMEDHTVYSYIQSRYYRSPEVLLGYQYTTAIDMWSFGCIVAELFLGLPLFPGVSEFDLLKRMIKILGEQPPDYVLKEAKNTSKFFKYVGSVGHEESSQVSSCGRSVYQALNEEEYEARESKKPVIGKEYFNNMNLEAIVKKYPYRKNLQDEDLAKESQIRLALIDFLRGLVEFDPAKRWSPLQASKHPFVTGEPFTSPYTPAPETPRVPVSHNMKVDHHPSGGHWFAAGLSPNVLGANRVAMYNNPHFQVMPYPHGGNFGSLGSHGSYNDGTTLGSSYGSYDNNNNNNMHHYYSPVGPSPMNNYTQGHNPVLGTSPDARRRIMQIPHGNGSFGFSPAQGNFAPMSLGTSPSQFTPPYGGSPGHYGPSSPARGNCHGSPLGKGTGQMNRRKQWGYSGSLQNQEPTSHWQGQGQGQYPDVNVNVNSSIESSPPVKGRSQMHHMQPNLNSQNRKPQHRNSGNHKPFKSETSTSLPDPGDWDPNYSEELLLQDDGSEVNNMTVEFGKSMNINQESFVGVGRFNQMPGQRPIQGFSHGEGSSPDMYTHPMMTPSHLMPHFSQFSPSRLGQQQQPGQRFNPRGMGIRGAEWNHGKQPPNSNLNFNSGGGGGGGPRSPRSSSSSSAPWGMYHDYWYRGS